METKCEQCPWALSETCKTCAQDNLPLRPARRDYLEGRVTHDEYYLALAGEHHIAVQEYDLMLLGIVSLVHLRDLLRRDPLLNMIPLYLFDGLTRRYNTQHPRQRLTLAEGCCVYKTLLKQLAAEGAQQ